MNAVEELPRQAPTAPKPKPRSAPLQTICRMLGVVLCSSTFAITLIVLLARWSPIAEITSHFRALYAITAAAALALLLVSRMFRWSLVAAVLLLWHGWAIAAWYVPPVKASSPAGPEIRVLTANVNADTNGYARLLDVIAHENPDVLFVQELSPAWAAAIESIHAEYPYRIISARTDYFGLGLYSRFPIENAETNDPINSDIPISRGDLMIEGRRLHFVNAHFAPPEGRMLTHLRYQQFVWLTGYLEALQGPVLVAGDFNCTMWSPLYRDMVRRGRLSDARQGHGVLASWYPLPGSLNVIPIDLILGGGGARFSGTHLTARIGSDHVPVATTMRVGE